jgi:hypothetical protein
MAQSKIATKLTSASGSDGATQEWPITKWSLLKQGLEVPGEILPAFGGSVTTKQKFPDVVEIELGGTPPFPDMLKPCVVHFDDNSSTAAKFKWPKKHPDGHFSFALYLYE